MFRLSPASDAQGTWREAELLCHGLQHLEHDDWDDCRFATMGILAGWNRTQCLYLLLELRGFLLHLQVDRRCDEE